MRPALVTARCAKRRCLGIPFAWLHPASVSSGAGTIRAGMGDALDQRVRSNSGIKDLFGFVGCLSANASVRGRDDATRAGVGQASTDETAACPGVVRGGWTAMGI